MEKIYKSCSPKYTDEDIKYKSGIVTFASHATLFKESYEQAIGLKPNEKIVGMMLDWDGITFYIENQ